LDKILHKKSRRKAHTFKKKADRTVLKLASSLLTSALGPALLRFKDILRLHKLCVFVSSQHLCPPSLHCGLQRFLPWFMLGFCNDNKSGGRFLPPFSTFTYHMCSLDPLRCVSALCCSRLISPTSTPKPCGCPVARILRCFILRAEETDDTLPGLGSEGRFR